MRAHACVQHSVCVQGRERREGVEKGLYTFVKCRVTFFAFETGDHSSRCPLLQDDWEEVRIGTTAKFHYVQPCVR